MERLVGVFGDEPLYWIDRVEDDYDEGAADVELGFNDIAAHPYGALVRATVDVLAAVPGVIETWHEDREVVLVRAPRVPLERLAGVVDRFWLDALRHTPPDPAYGDDICTPDLARAWSPAPVADPSRGAMLRAAARLPASPRRIWTYLGVGAVVTVAGLTMAAIPGGSSGVLVTVLGTANLAVGVRIALRRRAEAR